METTKIHLSTDELQLIHNEEWILTKNRVIEKITYAMGNLGMRMQLQAEKIRYLLISELLLSNPKISKGEKYQGLPYVILDYPRIFEKENIFAIRTFFWWGNFCSITLHVTGRYRRRTVKKLVENYKAFHRQGFYVSLSGNEWNHDLTTSDYQALTPKITAETEMNFLNADFFKLTARVELDQWEKMENELYGYYLMLLKLAEL